jgi:hypothetical protein
MTADSFVPDPGLSQAFNRYSYVINNPVKYTDPSGHIFQLFTPDTYIDIASAAIGTVSLVKNVLSGSWGDAAWDTAGLALDGASIFIPGLTTGAGFANQTARKTADVVADAVRAGSNATDVATDIGKNSDELLDISRNSDKIEKRIGYHATEPDVVPLIEKNGFRNGKQPGRLGSNGVYVNNTPEGAIAEFMHHNPGKKPAVLQVEYSPGVEAVTDIAPQHYTKEIPLNVDSVTAPSVRAPTTKNTNVFNNSVEVIQRLE